LIIEGLPACLLGAITLGILPDRPEDAHWLTHAEKQALRCQLDAETHPETRKDLWGALHFLAASMVLSAALALCVRFLKVKA
jgi:hypothetical protein